MCGTHIKGGVVQLCGPLGRSVGGVGASRGSDGVGNSLKEPAHHCAVAHSALGHIEYRRNLALGLEPGHASNLGAAAR